MTLIMSERNDLVFSSFDPVGLDELDSIASLQTRVDHKYVIRRSCLETLTAQLRSQSRVLEIDSRRDFGYRSTYFDTPELTSYHDAARKRPRRWKVRTRTYLDSDAHFVEVKTRNRRGRTVKKRQPAVAADHCHLGAETQRFVTETLAHRLDLPEEAGALLVARLQPTLTSEYRRVTLLIETDASRATVDSNLRVSLPDGSRRLLDDHVIIETKTSGRPSLVDRALWDLGVRPMKISKFGTGLALLRPSLPAAKWNRVLRNDFGWTPALVRSN